MSLELNRVENPSKAGHPPVVPAKAPHGTDGHSNETENEPQIRRTRGSASQKKSNAPIRVNGQSIDSTDDSSPDGTPSWQPSPREAKKGSAASVDAHGTTAATVAPSAATGTGRDAYAEVASSKNGRKAKSQRAGEKTSVAREEPRVPSEREEVPPGVEMLPESGAEFVEIMHECADLFEVGRRLLNSTDEKVAQRALERFLEMKYGKGAAPSDEPPQIVIDMPRPVRDSL